MFCTIVFMCLRLSVLLLAYVLLLLCQACPRFLVACRHIYCEAEQCSLLLIEHLIEAAA